MAAETTRDLFIGVDGGGTKCRVRLRDGYGNERGAVESGSANVYLDFATAVATIRSAVRAVLAQAGFDGAVASLDGAPAPTRLHVGLGLAGVSGPAMAERVQVALADLGTVAVTHDGDVACLGAHAGRDGGLIIAGTGSAAVARVGGVGISLGGRGFIMGDDGSGAQLGHAALRRALRAHDGLAPHTPLTTSLMAAFDDDPVALIEWARTARSSDFGHYAPMVVASALENDPVGRLLVMAAAAAVADLGAALQRRGAARLCLVGGFSAALVPFLSASLTAVLHPPLLDALDGALLFAGCPVPAAVATG